VVVLSNREELKNNILDIEMNMLQEVPVKLRAACQDDLKTFFLMRGAQYVGWSHETLQSYYNDLLNAKREGKNLMILKYGRMDNLIDTLNLDPLIEQIIDIQFRWQKELAGKYPGLTSQVGRPIEETVEPTMNGSVYFKNYLRSELETYSSATLKLLYRDVLTYKEKGSNMVMDIYLNMVTDLGFRSLEEAEKLAQKAAQYQRTQISDN